MNIGDISSAVAAYSVNSAAVQTGEKITVKLSGAKIDEAVKTGRADSLVLSDEAKQKLEKLSQAVKEKNELAMNMYNMQRELESSNKQAEAQSKAMNEEFKMLEIARRIQHGDKVPYEDEKALLEYDADLYSMSKELGMLRQNEKRKEYDSLLDDEEPVEEGEAIEQPTMQGVKVSGSEGAEVSAENVSEVSLE